MPARLLKVFLASPGDVLVERDALSRLVRNINEVLAFLAPERQLTLELVRYETHTYPDIGRPQDVVNRQIPLDYDIFVGAMWRRAGTPTASHPSGTIEEFWRAYEKRKSSHLPRIMFYFCDQPIAIPDLSELDQLTQVIKFREEVNKLGLTWSYPSHEEFVDHVRPGLLRAIRDLLTEESRLAQPHVPSQENEPPLNIARTDLLTLAAQYEDVRAKLPSGGPRTRRMTAIFSEMKSKAAAARPLLPEFESSASAASRLAAIAILQMFPNADHLDWLAERLDNPNAEKPFIGYQAAVALLEAVQALPPSQCQKLKKALQRATQLASSLPQDSDRLDVLTIASEQFERKCGQSQ